MRTQPFPPKLRADVRKSIDRFMNKVEDLLSQHSELKAETLERVKAGLVTATRDLIVDGIVPSDAEIDLLGLNEEGFLNTYTQALIHQLQSIYPL